MVSLLSFADGEPFAIGATRFTYSPTEDRDLSLRIIIQVAFDGVPVPAVVDTGAPYVVCTPIVAHMLGLHRADALEAKRLLIRGIWWDGHLFRMPVRFLAVLGDYLDIAATAFVPVASTIDQWGSLPAFIGMGGCLERMRFAVDPANDLFYFDPLEQT